MFFVLCSCKIAAYADTEMSNEQLYIDINKNASGNGWNYVVSTYSLFLNGVSLNALAAGGNNSLNIILSGGMTQFGVPCVFNKSNVNINAIGNGIHTNTDMTINGGKWSVYSKKLHAINSWAARGRKKSYIFKNVNMKFETGDKGGIAMDFEAIKKITMKKCTIKIVEPKTKGHSWLKVEANKIKKYVKKVKIKYASTKKQRYAIIKMK